MLLAGKGHENTQILRDRTFEFDDREKAREILRSKGFSKQTCEEVEAISYPESLRLKLKQSPLETECGGEWRKWLKRWVSRCPRVLTPWPGWPACRLIHALFGPENCLSPYAVRVTMDTVLLPGLWLVERRPGWWRANGHRNTRPEIRGKLFVVDDTLDGLHRLAARACDRWRKAKPGRKIGGVAGSIGKTTTKEILAALVGARFRVLKTQGNLNNEYGLPLTLLGLSDEYDAAIVEMGMSHRGELARLAQIASPDVGVITRVAVEHSGVFRFD